MSYGIYDKITEQNLKQRTVCPNLQRVDTEVGMQRQAAQQAFNIRHILHHVDYIHQSCTVKLAVLHLGEQQKVAVKARHAVVNLVEVLYYRGLPFGKFGQLRQYVELASEHRQRRLQFVRGVFGKLLLHTEALYASCHQVA